MRTTSSTWEVNSGWNISALVTRDLYWVGGAGDWNDPNHWSLSSGGASAGCTPNRLDNVFFDANSLWAPAFTVYLPTWNSTPAT